MAKLSQWQKPEYQRAHIYDLGVNGYVGEYSPSGDTISAHGIFRLPRYAAGSPDVGRIILVAWGNGSANQRIAIGVRSNDHSDIPSRNKITLSSINSAGTIILRVMSTIDVCDNRYHSFQVSWDAATGALIFMVDMVPVEDASWANRILTTGTLSGVVNSQFMVGMSAIDNPAAHWIGELGFIGQRSGYYVTDWTPFFYSNGLPKRLDMTGWTEWGVQPGWFHPYSDMEGNLGSNGASRRVGNIFPIAEGRALRATKDGVQNPAGIVFHQANPRIAKPVTLEDSFPQVITPGAFNTRYPVVLDANGFAYRSGSYATSLFVTGLAAKATTIRLHQGTFRYENVAITTNHGFALQFNMSDSANYWAVFIVWTGTQWQADLAQVNPGYVSRGVSTLVGVNYPAHFVLSIYEAGDNINYFLTGYEVDVPANRSSCAFRYTVASRALKTATGIGVINNTDPGTNLRWRDVLVMDL